MDIKHTHPPYADEEARIAAILSTYQVLLPRLAQNPDKNCFLKPAKPQTPLTV